MPNFKSKLLPTPVKAKSDKKDYRSIELPNGLRALLIADLSYPLDKLDEEEKAEMMMEEDSEDGDGSDDESEEDMEENDDDEDDDEDEGELGKFGQIYEPLKSRS